LDRSSTVWQNLGRHDVRTRAEEEEKENREARGDLRLRRWRSPYLDGYTGINLCKLNQAQLLEES
jgi:hypothetical protein